KDVGLGKGLASTVAEIGDSRPWWARPVRLLETDLRSSSSSALRPAARPTSLPGSWRRSWASGSVSRYVDRIRSREKRIQDVIDSQIVLLLKAGVRNSGHDGELLAGIGQPCKKMHQVIDSGNAVELATHHDRRHSDGCGIDKR